MYDLGVGSDNGKRAIAVDTAGVWEVIQGRG